MRTLETTRIPVSVRHPCHFLLKSLRQVSVLDSLSSLSSGEMRPRGRILNKVKAAGSTHPPPKSRKEPEGPPPCLQHRRPGLGVKCM